MSTEFADFRVDLMTTPAKEIAARLAADGVVTFDGLRTRAGLLDAAARLMSPWQHPDAEADSVTVITPRGAASGRTGWAGFRTRELQPHTEASWAIEPPSLMLLACVQPSAVGGQSFFVDTALVWQDLAQAEPYVTATLSVPGAARFGSSPGYGGPVFAMVKGRMTVRLRFDELAQFNVPQPAIVALRQAIARHVVIVALKPGQGFLVDNRRMLHGRYAFLGTRVMHRLLGNPLPNLEFRPGFRPSMAGATTC